MSPVISDPDTGAEEDLRHVFADTKGIIPCSVVTVVEVQHILMFPLSTKY
jgi:hypothetical protein